MFKCEQLRNRVSTHRVGFQGRPREDPIFGVPGPYVHKTGGGRCVASSVVFFCFFLGGRKGGWGYEFRLCRVFLILKAVGSLDWFGAAVRQGQGSKALRGSWECRLGLFFLERSGLLTPSYPLSCPMVFPGRSNINRLILVPGLQSADCRLGLWMLNCEVVEVWRFSTRTYPPHTIRGHSKALY